MITVPPQTCAGQEAVFDAGADHALQVRVSQPVGLHCAHVLMRQIDPRHSFIIGRKCDRDFEFR